MGWYTLASPGKVVNGEEIGPCIEPCKHTDCAATRKDAESLCRNCNEPIGYETPMYFGKDGKHSHARCEWKENKKERGCHAGYSNS